MTEEIQSKVQLYSLDLHEELLSHLSDPDAWYVITSEQFSSELIEDEFVATVFRWQQQYIRQHGKPAPIAVVEDEFKDEELQLETPQTEIGDLLDRLRTQYAKNQQREALRDLVKLQNENPLGIPQALLHKGRELKDLLDKRGEVFGIADLDRAKHRYDQKVLAGPGASLGFKELDEYFYGMRGVNFFIGAPKSMKSWLIAQSTMTNAFAGRYVHTFPLELPVEEMDMRVRCLLGNVPWWHYLRNAMSPEDWDAVHEGTEYLGGHGVYRLTKPQAGHRGIEEMVYTARDAGADVVIIDQLQYVENEKGQSLGSLNQTGEYWNVLNKARDLSDDGPILFAHQFNRQAMFSDTLPSMEFAKGSSAIEEVATLALGLWANKDMRASKILGVGTLCARNHMYAAWEVGIELNQGCSFDVIGRCEDDE